MSYMAVIRVSDKANGGSRGADNISGQQLNRQTGSKTHIDIWSDQASNHQQIQVRSRPVKIQVISSQSR